MPTALHHARAAASVLNPEVRKRRIESVYFFQAGSDDAATEAALRELRDMVSVVNANLHIDTHETRHARQLLEAVWLVRTASLD